VSRVLITGGAGFIGSHLADALLARGTRVRVLDSLVPQVHGPDRRRPAYLSPDVDLVVGDVRDRDAVVRAMRDVDAVVHLAASVGVGQSMYAIADYTSVNSGGTAVVLEVAIARRLPRLVVASSMSIYGEGAYVDVRGRPAIAASRTVERLRRGQWELEDETGAPLTPVPTAESKTPALESVYALTKYDQERMCLMIGRAYGLETVALRLFNTYGPRQALSNPYTGVLAIFASRLLNEARPLIFEDGLQRRDFVSVHDVVAAFVAALESERAVGHPLNIASGSPRTIQSVAESVAAAVGRAGLGPELTGSHRVGDIRHCFADIACAEELLGYRPAVDFDAGLRELAEWLRGQPALDRVGQARAELESRGLAL
ncbi:MAG: NAD-dependent epimerase/dehydratase family protein, partial [Polyangiaceae bacterium]|nr:NAD-dependent epimerase/dehydratase family protein [Polyangiaceae bacterium]